MWDTFQSVRKAVFKSLDLGSETVYFFADAGIAEASKWKFEAQDIDKCHPVSDIIFNFPLERTRLDDFSMLDQQCKIIFWLSQIDSLWIRHIKEILTRFPLGSECAIVTHVTPAAMKVALECEEDGDEYLLNQLHPIVPSLHYLPSYSFPIIPSAEYLDLRIITSHPDRNVHSLTLSLMSEDYDQLDQKCIYEINAADLSGSVKKSLKQLAHNVAGSIICDLGIDVSESMFAMGKTASLVGHSVLAMTEGYSDIRSGKNLEVNARLLNLPNTAVGHNTSRRTAHSPTRDTSLKSGSLILIDRLEDLFTPIIHGGEQPVLHRVLNAIKMDALQKVTSHSTTEDGNVNASSHIVAKEAEILVDISLQPDWYCSVQEILQNDSERNEESSDNSYNSVSRPMNAVSTLPVHGIPSICYHESQSSTKPATLLADLMTATEEQGRSYLVDELKQRIVLEKGVLPPVKKRGIGAEILALVQSLLKAPGYDVDSSSSSSSSNGQPSIATISRSQSLLSLAMSVIETMQRSSAKQFTTVCTWKAALDTRVAREAEMMKMLQQHSDKDDAGAVVRDVMSVIQRPLTQTPPLPRSNESKNSKGDTAAEVALEGPVDASHVLLLTIGLVGYMRFKTFELNFIDSLSEALGRHILLYSSDEELQYLRYLGVLTSSMEEIIAEARFEGLTEDTADYTLSSMSMLLSKRFAILRELQVMYHHVVHRTVAKKIAEAKNIPWDSSIGSEQQHNNFAEQILSNTYEMQYLRDVFQPESPGLLSRLVEDCFLYHRTRQSSPLSLLLEHIQSPFQQMKNTGLELLSKGLGSFGFGLSRVVKAATEVPHPGAQRTLIIFVLGGITYKEVAQVRAILDKHQSSDAKEEKWRIVLLSNRTISSEEVITTLFRPLSSS